MFKYMSIKNKVMLLLIIPGFFLLLISMKSIINDYSNVKTLEKLETVVLLSEKISALVHETQKERGRTAGYLGSNGKKFKNELFSQKKLTNKKVDELKEFIEKHNIKDISLIINDSLSFALNDIKNINAKRDLISSLNIPKSKAISYYTKMNGKLLNIIVEISKVSKSPEITKQLIAYSSFLLSKERAGIERAIGASVLADDFITYNNKVKFNKLIAEQDSFLDTFKKYSTKDSVDFYNNTLNTKVVKEVSDVRQTLMLSSEKHNIISDMKALVGYGGFIHNFKNYIIRGKEKYITKIKEEHERKQDKGD